MVKSWGWVVACEIILSSPGTRNRGTLYFPIPFSHFHFPIPNSPSQSPVPNPRPRPSPSPSRLTIYLQGLAFLGANQTTAYANFTPPGDYRHMRLFRDVSSEDVETQKLDMMPGFRFTWWYSGTEVTPDNKFKDENITKQFVR